MTERDRLSSKRTIALRVASLGVVGFPLLLAPEAASAQQLIDPFAGSMAPGAVGPYGSDVGVLAHVMQSFQTMVSSTPQLLSGLPGGDMSSGTGSAMGSPTNTGDSASGGGEGKDKAEAPDSGGGEDTWELFIGACAGGAFLGGYSVATAAAPAAATGVAAPAVGTAIASAAAIGCGLGVSTAVISLGAVSVWRSWKPSFL